MADKAAMNILIQYVRFHEGRIYVSGMDTDFDPVKDYHLGNTYFGEYFISLQQHTSWRKKVRCSSKLSESTSINQISETIGLILTKVDQTRANLQTK